LFKIILLPFTGNKEKNMDRLRAQLGSWDDLLGDIFTGFGLDRAFGDAPKQLPSVIVSSSWPPSNVYVKNHDFVVELAVAGYSKEEVLITFKEDYLVVKLDKGLTAETNPKDDISEEVKDGKDKIFYFQKGLKIKDTEISFFVDPKYFDKSTIKAQMENGLLRISVDALPEPAVEERKIEIDYKV
jgi:HSP20 family molecular chaperone IbpA